MKRAFFSILSERNKLIIYFESGKKTFLKTYFVQRVVELSNFTWVLIVTTPAFKKIKENK